MSRRKRVRLKDVRQGRTFWCASAFSKEVRQITVVGAKNVKSEFSDGLFREFKTYSYYINLYNGNRVIQSHMYRQSLLDMGIIENWYNKNAIFFNKRDAENYLKYVTTPFNEVLTQRNEDWDLGDDYGRF